MEYEIATASAQAIGETISLAWFFGVIVLFYIGYSFGADVFHR